MLDLRQLQYFVAVGEEGQMTRAAAKLHVAQPALSQSIAALEARLGVELLERHARGVSLTPAGESFMVKARAAVAAAAAADKTAQAFARADSGTLEVGHIGPPPEYTEPQTFAIFAEAHPEVEVSMRHMRFPCGTTSSWLEDVDVALCHAPEEERELRIEVLREEQTMLIVPKVNPLAERESLTVEEVLDERFILFEEKVQPAWAAFHTLDHHRGGPPPTVTNHRVATPSEMLAAMASRVGVTTVPACDAAIIVKVLRGVVAVPVVDAAPMRVALVWRRSPHNPLVAALVDAATGRVRGLRPPDLAAATTTRLAGAR